MLKMILIRHPEVEPEWKPKCYGTIDVPLSAAGLAGSKALADAWPRDEVPTRIYHSGLKRTEFLARIIGDRFPAAPVLTESRLREREFGSWQGKSWDEIFELEPNFHDLIHRPDTYRPPGGESTTEMQNRVWSWFREAISHPVARRNETIVTVTHSGPIACLVGKCLDLPATEWQPWMVKYLDRVHLEVHAPEAPRRQPGKQPDQMSDEELRQILRLWRGHEKA